MKCGVLEGGNEGKLSNRKKIYDSFGNFESSFTFAAAKTGASSLKELGKERSGGYQGIVEHGKSAMAGDSGIGDREAGRKKLKKLLVE